MKNALYCFASIALALSATSCIKDDFGNGTPVQAGDEIIFGSSLPKDGIETRTVYGEPDLNTQSFPVYWENGDEIAIFCPQSPTKDKLVRYVIGVNGDKQSTATSVTKIGNVGLQWSADADLHKFYGFYPAKNVHDGNPDGDYGHETTGLFHMNVPVSQTVKKFEQMPDGNWKSDINTDLAIMYAYRGQKRSLTPDTDPETGQEPRNIELGFKPLSTILEITVQGPAEENVTMTLTNINVRTTDGTPIVGDFTAQVYPGSNDDESTESTVICKVNMDGKVDNNISIPCSWIDNGTTKYVTLKKGQKLFVKAFLIPTETEIDSRNVVVSVSTTKGTARKTLVDASGKSFMIAPHKVNRVTLPALKTNFDVAYWINSLDLDVYLTELSIPGSKMTAETADNGASAPYQSTTIEQQYKDGVRAFILQTNRASDGTLYVSRINKPLTTVLSEISDYLKNSKAQNKNEFAFTLITYNSGSGSQKDWMISLQNTINNISSDIIYKEEITPNTTIRDVVGKIVVKCNYNDNEMIEGITTSAPMLYTQWLETYVEGGLDMPWGNPYNTPKLHWLYQEVTTVTHPTKNVCGSLTQHYSGEDSYENKTKYINTIFDESLKAYQDGSHNTWFMNDLGGCYSWCEKTGWHVNHTIVTDVVSLTTDLNQLAIDLLNKRTENAGLGLIFMNFANRQEETGVAYKSDLLLQTIIDNNFKFALRKKETGTTTYNADYTDGGFAIE